MSEPESRALSGRVSAGLAVLAQRGREALAQLSRPPLHQLSLNSYRMERVTDLTFPVGTALLEGGFLGVLADKIFHVHPALLALISAAPMFGNLSSFFWARIAEGRRTVPMTCLLIGLCVCCPAAIALLPASPEGGVLLAAVLVAGRLLLGGVITLRSLVWTVNYPRAARGRVTARLTILSTLTLTATSVLGSIVLQARPENFRVLYAAGAAIAAVGALAFWRVRLLSEHEPGAAARERAADAIEPSPALANAAAAAPKPPRGLWSVLRHDRVFARYQVCQFVLGVANMLVEAPLIYLVSRELQASYTVSIALLQAIPLGLSVVVLPFWAARLDRVHVLDFRAGHSWLFAGSQLLTWVGAMLGSLPIIGLGRVMFGIARGGGSLAWNLGHNDFAAPDSAALYMGIHVTLTGVRGAIAPFLGMLLYLGWAPLELFGAIRLPGFAGIGAHILLLAGLLSIAATRGFNALNRERLSRL